MTDDLFLALLGRPESSILDFKADIYDFTNDTDNLVISKFVKDVISFTNTIREEPAYIIFGVKELADGQKQKTGITKNIDETILQDKIKNKLNPRPLFRYFTKRHEDLLYGIMEFPIKKYELPVTSAIKLKGVEIGKSYYRQGSSNTEALTMDIIHIHNWLRSLPDSIVPGAAQTDSSSLLKRLLAREETLSAILPDIYTFARENSYPDLQYFCKLEIKGFDVTDDSTREEIKRFPEKYRYRSQQIKISLDEIVQTFYTTSEQVRRHIENDSDFFDVSYFFKDPLIDIESAMNRTDGFGKARMSIKEVLPKSKKDAPVYGYLFQHNYISLYKSIRQKLIDLIMEVK